MTDQKQPLNAMIVQDGDNQQDAIDLGRGIFMSRDVSNIYRVITPDGDVLINTGIEFNDEENFRRLSAVSSNSVAKIVFTQSHADHIGGWSRFNTPDTETIAQTNFTYVYDYFEGLRTAMTRRSRRLWSGDIRRSVSEHIRPVITTTFQDSHTFELGGRRFELYSVPGGETLDSLVVWLPDDRIAFTGNMTGPIFGHVPNLYTLRGDKIRYVQWFIDSVQRVIDLNPEILITGHGDPVHGAESIRNQLTAIRDATQYIKDRTFDGMNAGKDLWTLMNSVELPEELAIGQGHGKVPWLVRAIWEEYFGWFRYESSTELYGVPVSAVSKDFVELAGGEGVILSRAREHLGANKPLHALHLVEAVLSTAGPNAEALHLKLAANERLLASCGRENFSEVRWLESEIRTVGAALEECEV